MVRSRQKRITPESGEILAAGQLSTHRSRALAVRPRDQHVRRIIEQALRDGHHLLRRLALGEDHLGHAVTQRAMMVHFGEAQVFEGHMPHADHSRIDIHSAAAHLLEQ